jgi:protocatechuate 3,4-dioxygenase beta subunit
MDRRNVLKIGLATVGGMFALSKASAQAAPLCEGTLMPVQPKGPFYPVVDQLDTDADLVVVAGRPAVASGQVVLVKGQVTDQFCAPVQGALVEIWQACESGRYDHPSDPNTAPLDPNFQYWGKAVTDAQGNYLFRTILPGAYPAAKDWIRPPHIHFKISQRGYKELITQMFFAGQKWNDEDLILQDLTPEEQKQVVVEFRPGAGQPHPVGQFDIQISKLVKK